MKKDKLEYGIARYGTPLYIFDIDILKEQTKRLRDKLGRRAGLCYAMKANPFLTEHMARLADRIEVCSMGEFNICRELGVAPEKLLISGVVKKKEDINEIMDHCKGKCAYTVESVRQFHYLDEWSGAHSTELRLYLRLGGRDQFGMDEAMLNSVIGLINMSPYLRIEGIHYFTGTQKRNLEQLEKEIRYLDDFMLRLNREHGCDIRCLEYGPGIAVPYFKGKPADTFEDEGIGALADMIGNMKWNGKVTLEMGRAFAAMCGYYLTSICDVKTNNDKNFCLVDGGSHQLNYDGQIRGMYEPCVSILEAPYQERTARWTVCGSLCSVNDILCTDVEFSGVRSGRTLVFERTGAYSAMEGMSLFLSHALPAAVSYGMEEGWRLLRTRTETYPMNMAEQK